jgi:cytochrome bd ubiquinol oxidase subunit II
VKSLWFVIVAFFWVGFLILEGFDFGVGMLHSVVGKNDAERRVAINTIGPTWDGNEVWLIVAVAAIFAAFPLWYGTMFSAFYLIFLVTLLALMARGVSFEYRGKLDDPTWGTAWRWAMTIGSALVPLLIGIALSDLLHGLPINRSHNFTGAFGNLFVPYSVWTGVTVVGLCLLQGAAFITLKTTGALHDRTHQLTRALSIVAGLLVVGFAIWSGVISGRGVGPNIFGAIAIVAVLVAAALAGTHREGLTFATASVAMGATVATIFAHLYSNVMVSSTSSAFDITVGNASSSSYALTVMTVVACIFAPLVLAYQGWSYHVFRRRLAAPRAAVQLGELDTSATADRPSSPQSAPEAPSGP